MHTYLNINSWLLHFMAGFPSLRGQGALIKNSIKQWSVQWKGRRRSIKQHLGLKFGLQRIKLSCLTPSKWLTHFSWDYWIQLSLSVSVVRQAVQPGVTSDFSGNLMWGEKRRPSVRSLGSPLPLVNEILTGSIQLHSARAPTARNMDLPALMKSHLHMYDCISEF